MSRGDALAQPGGVDPVGDAVVAGGYYGGRWVLRRLRSTARRSADPRYLPMAGQEPAGGASNVRLVEPSSGDGR
jgi:hypothetical protein